MGYIFVKGLVSAFSGTRQRFDIVSQDKKSGIYIKVENWGLTGDHQRTVITADSDFEVDADSSTELIFHGLDPFFFRHSGDTLFLYLDEKVAVPQGFVSRVIIQQVEIDKKMRRQLAHDPDYTKL